MSTQNFSVMMMPKREGRFQARICPGSRIQSQICPGTSMGRISHTNLNNRMVIDKIVTSKNHIELLEYSCNTARHTSPGMTRCSQKCISKYLRNNKLDVSRYGVLTTLCRLTSRKPGREISFRANFWSRLVTLHFVNKLTVDTLAPASRR